MSGCNNHKMPSDTKVQRKEKTYKRFFKYVPALKQLIPFRPTSKNKKVLPTRYAGFFSSISVSWLTALMWKAYKNRIEVDELWSLPFEECSKVNCLRLERLWKEECVSAKERGEDPKLWKAIWRFSRTRVLLAQILAIIIDISFYVGPMVYLQQILNYINSTGVDHSYGAKLFFLKIAVTGVTPIVVFHLLYLVALHSGARLTGALQALVYKKTLSLRSGGENLAAQVINFSTNDTERIYEACISAVFLVDVPFIFVMNLCFCIYSFGPWSSVGYGVYLAFYPTIALIGRAQSRIREKTIRETDRRVGLMSEILNSIRLIKMYAWEEPFAKKIADIRRCEMKMHRIGALLASVTNTLTPSIGILATVSTLLCFTLAGVGVTSAQAFTMFSLFSLMEFTLNFLPYTVRCLVEAKISLDRMESLLILPEHKKTCTSLDSTAFAIQMNNANFAWEETTIDDDDVRKAKNGQKSLAYQKLDSNMPNGKESKKDADNLSSPSAFRKGQRQSISGSVVDLVSSGLLGEPTTENKKRCLKTSVTLFEVTLTVPHGKLIGVCGSIGSGKSSLISAVCGDMRMERGNMYVNGKVALVTQQAWIHSGTLRENILLGSPYDDVRYKKAIHYCCLQSDLDMFPAGDMTEIGERGINLSGGQKQRVNLARAVYSNRDILLLDDPLSAVDSKVANSIFNHCIKEYLKGKTVLLVTHALHLLEQCDEIVVMNNGRVSECGTHAQLLANGGDYFWMVGGMAKPQRKISKRVSGIVEDDAVSEDLGEKMEEDEEGLGLDGRLTTEESKESGGVSTEVYKIFIKVCGGWCVTFCCVAVVVLFALLRILNVVWLQVWLDEGDGLKSDRLENVTSRNLTLTEDELKGSIIDNPLLWMYQTVYCLSILAIVIVGISKGVGITFSVLKGASRLHNAMFKSILRSPMSFFDTTPSGRILNRFSRDLDELDVRIPYFLEFVMQGVLYVLGQSILVCIIYPWLTIPLAVVGILFVVIDIFLNAGVKELKRIDNMKKSPVIQHIGSSLSGLSVIRTFGQQELFTDRMYKSLDDHTVAHLVFRLSSRWYVFRTDILSLTINSFVTGICIFTKGLVSTATAGLALSTMHGVCDYFPYLMKMKSEFQSRFTAVERLSEYSYNLESEASWETTGKDPPRDWPEFGVVELRKVCVRYRPDLPLVLHDIDATFEAGQKIGIVGRTGAGKSSLISTLLRLVELECGSIYVDGVDVSTLGLHTLRSAISVIPQDPVLFQGSIRYNLDPFEEHSDASVWEALERSNLKKVVQQQERGLQSAVATAGENFSVGERQLICLTRALLRKSKVLLLDEATASVDLETDQMIQATIRNAFAQSTVITIAHRLNTITTYDKVLVLKEGRLVEFDTPNDLMRKDGSIFREMMSAIGVFTVEQMKSLT